MNKKTFFLIAGILSIIIVIEAVWSVSFILASSVKRGESLISKSIPVLLEKKDQPKVKLSLKTEQAQPALWENITVSLYLDPDNQSVQALDVIINFDNNMLEAINFIPLVDLPSAEYWFGQTGTAINNENGKISFGLIMPQQTINEPIKIGEIVFTPKQAGQTTLEFDFEPQKTTGSNAVLKGGTEDSLYEVENLDITIGNSVQSRKNL